MIWPLVKVIVAGSVRPNPIVSPGFAAAMVSLSDPEPLSAVFMTVRVVKALTRRGINPEFTVPRAAKINAPAADATLDKTDLLIKGIPQGLVHLFIQSVQMSPIPKFSGPEVRL